jgi:hypothetical protein
LEERVIKAAHHPRVPEERISLLFINNERAELGEAIDDAIRRAKQDVSQLTAMRDDALESFASSRERLDERVDELHVTERRLVRLQSLQSMLAMMPEEEDED